MFDLDQFIIDNLESIPYVGDIILITLELMLAAVLAGVIGYEREKRGHAAGLRTHILVSLGSCLVMIVSISAPGLNISATRDPARLAAQVVSGIGFLGAGTIIQNGTDVKGLTTAATLWLCGGIGLATGSGYFTGAIITSLISMLALTVLTKLERRVYQHSPKLILKIKTDEHVLKDIIEIANISKVEIKEIHSQVSKDEQGQQIYTFYISLSPSSYNFVEEFVEALNETFSPIALKVFKKQLDKK